MASERRAFFAIAWVTVLNPDGIASGNTFFHYGAPCLLLSTAYVEPVRPMQGQMLYRIREDAPQVYGSSAPPGTLFCMPPEELAAHVAREQAHKDEQHALRNEMRVLLRAHTSKGQP